ncbi:MAG: hypothetical protein R3Y22_07870 [Bacteroidales bacterium]
MKKSKWKKSAYLPITLGIYLVLMSYIGYPEFERGNYYYYFGVIGFTSAVIVALYFMLKRKEGYQRDREDDIKRNSEKRESDN